jgi:hypothetical protein
MKMFRMNVSIPLSLKAKLDTERRTGTTASGLIRHLLEQHFNKGKKAV